MEDLIYRANLVEQPFQYIRGCQHRQDLRDKRQHQTKVFEREVNLKDRRQEKTDLESEQDAEKREKDGVGNSHPHSIPKLPKLPFSSHCPAT
jgi:hypothetical protein